MISHDNPISLLSQDPSGPATLSRIVRSGGCTGIVGVHGYVDYLKPTNLESYAALIDQSRKAFDSLPAPPGQKVHGDRHLALGVDWFVKKDLDLHDWAGRSPEEPLKGLVSILMAHNYTDKEIQNILGLNMVRIFRAAWADKPETCAPF